MEQVTFKGEDLIWSLKRIEFLLEELLLHTIAERFKGSSEDEINTSMKETIDAVTLKLQSFFESLPNSK